MRCSHTINTVFHLQYKDQCETVKCLIEKAKREHLSKQIPLCEGDQGKLFEIINNLIGRAKSISLPTAESNKILADKCCDFFVTKISNICNDLAVLESTTVPLSCPPVSSLLTPAENVLEHFKPLSVKEVGNILKHPVNSIPFHQNY